MTEKFTYYADYGDGYEKITIYDNNLKNVFKVHEDWAGVVIHELEGSFKLLDNDFTIVNNIFNQSGFCDIPFRIYENGSNITGTLIYEGYFNTFSDFNFNEKTIEIKSFKTELITDKILGVINSEKLLISCSIAYSSVDTYYDLFCNTLYSSSIMSEKSYYLSDIIKGLLRAIFPNELSLPVDFDETDCYHDEEIIDIQKLRILDLHDYIADAFGGIIDGSRKKITLTIIFQMLESLFRIFWYVDETNALIKFKYYDEFISNELDLSDYLIDSNQKYYDFKKNYKNEYIKFHDNNELTAGTEWLDSNRIIYDRIATDENIINSIPFLTCYQRITGSEFSSDGWFLAYVDNATNKMEAEAGAITSTVVDNMKLSQANVLRDHYSDFINTDRDNYSINNVDSTSIPNYYLPIIELREVNITLDSIVNFYDGIVYEKIGTQKMLGRVNEMSTDLNTNITKFKCHQYYSDLHEVS